MDHPREDLSRTSNLDQALTALLKERALPDVLEQSKDLKQAFQRLSWKEKRSDKEGIAIEQAHDANDLLQVYRLVHDAYVERGYIEPQADGSLILYPHLDNIQQTTVLLAREKDLIVGTNSLTLDGPNGLPSDQDFKRECDAIRNERRPLAGSWRLCTRTGFRDERKIVMGLIATTVRLALDLGVKVCVFTINPRHAAVYQNLLNMQLVSRREETVRGLQNAPAVFMRCDFETLPKWCLKR